MGEYVSPVIRRLLSNVTGNLKKAVGFGDYFLKISEFFKSQSDRFTPVFCLSKVIESQ